MENFVFYLFYAKMILAFGDVIMEEKEIKQKRKIKIYGIVMGIICFIFQYAIYRLANAISDGLNISPFSPKIAAIDDLIPVVSIFVIPYLWSYVYWITGPIVASMSDFKHFLNVMLTYFVACIIGAIVFVFAPSYIDRVAEGVYNRPQNNLFDWILQIIYDTDGKEIGFNLFPSFHCLLTVICFLGAFRKKEIPLVFRIYSFIMMILIFLSTVFTKQHYIIDMVGGIGIALIVWLPVWKFNLGVKVLGRPIEYFKNKFKKEAKEEE